ncbi:MAG TPA: VWA domain-containing protein [Candidatus Marinimicrobia bacterium]|nr:VWA domain-containing protein [Candidatus Neomarinimicrobiota bacterium]MDP7122206.1 VWA domain-containing protein [Candidatus Neomarinimicrobiota bacterium]MDP7484181.1 VWA domain-containing protein [Candidatus Neomarinimicrobiota bacterium]MDP7528274.1 VWA domain-containing protein [Candidatus Neomarinimicrobiota bacterium]MDP7715819.1 VWA domain-containing protein [Candidatus Neomarinimicrobiota bacterium]|tara:strand:+ start:7774 stop:9015 length:1242 start_codon:yes stop_codon:yes gene_type:complete
MVEPKNSFKPVESRLHDAIASFGRFVRQAGCELGTGEIMNAVRATSYIDITNREDFKSALRATFITSHKFIPVFDQLFDLYWRNPDRLENVSDILRRLYESRLAQAELESMKQQAEQMKQRHLDSFKPREEGEGKQESEDKTFDLFVYSPEEILREKRFDAYTEDELKEAKEFLNRWRWEFGEKRLRRLKPGRKRHRLNLRGTIRKNIFPTQDFVELAWRKQKWKPRPLIILCDISGSMETYTRILMHFIFTLHAINPRLEAFTFGTRLNRITHTLRHKDVDDTMDLLTVSIKDWSGGTRIGETLETFNLLWARRVLGGGAVVLIISDGWDTGNVEKLKNEIDRLHRSCHRLIWLNPNLGYDDFQPLTRGVQTLLPYTDIFLPIHNLNSLVDLGKVLATLNNRRPVSTLPAYA